MSGENNKVLDKNEMSEAQKRTFDDVSKKLNEFLKDHGNKKDLDGVDFIKSAQGTYESNEEKEIEKKIGEMKNIEEKLNFLKDFLDALKHKELLKEFNEEKTKILKLKSNFNILKKPEKISFDASNLMLKSKEILKINGENNVFLEKNGKNLDDFNKFSKDILGDIKINSILSDNKEKKDLGSIKKENQDFYLKYSELNKNFLQKFKNNTKEFSDTIKDRNNLLTNIGVINGNYTNTIKSFNDTEVEIKNIDLLINGENKNISENDLPKLKEKRKQLENKIKILKSKLEHYEKDFKDLNKKYEKFNKQIEELKEKALKFKNDLEKKFLINGKKIGEYIEGKKEELRKITKDTNKKETNINNLEINSLNKAEIREMLEKAEKMKKNNPTEYNEFIKVIKEVAKDGDISSGLLKYDSGKEFLEGDIGKIRKAFRDLIEADKNNIINEKKYLLGLVKDDSLKVIIRNYINKRNISINEITELRGIINMFDSVKEKFKMYITSNLDIIPEYIKIKENLFNFLKGNSEIDGLKKVSIELKKVIKYYNENSNVIVNQHEKEGKGFAFQDTILGLGDIFSGTKKEVKNKIKNISKNVNLINDFINKNPKKYKNLEYVIYGLYNTYGNINDTEKFYRSISIKQNITKSKLVEIRALDKKLQIIVNNLDNKEFLDENFTELIEKSEKLENIQKNIKNKGINILKEKKEIPLNLKQEFENKLKTLEKKNISYEKLKNIESIFNNIDIIIKQYNNLIELEKKGDGSNEKIKEIKNIILSGIKQNFILDSNTQNYINLTLIELGAGGKNIDEKIKNLEKQIFTKLNEENIFEQSLKSNYENLYKLKIQNRLVYLRVLSQFKNLKGNEIKISLKLWNNIIGKKLNSKKGLQILYSKDFDKLVDEVMKEKISDKGFTDIEANNFIKKKFGISDKIMIGTNKLDAAYYKKQSLLMLASIEDKNSSFFSSLVSDEDLLNAKKLIKYAINKDAFGDIRIINTLKLLKKGSDSDKIRDETIQQFKLMKKYKDDKGSFHSYSSASGEVMLLSNDEKNPHLLKEVKLNDFKNNMTKALESNDSNEITTFIMRNPRATMSFFSYFMNSKNGQSILTPSQQILFYSKYKDFISGLNSVEGVINEISGDSKILSMIMNKFGEDGVNKLKDEMDRIFKKVLKTRDLAELEKLGIKDNEKMKEILLDMLEQMNYSEKEKKLLIKAIKEGEFSSEQLKDMKDNFDFMLKQKEIVLNIIGKYEKNDIERNVIFSKITEILEGENIPKAISDKEKLKIIIKNLKKYIFKKFGDNIGSIVMKDSLNELINFIGKDQKSKIFGKIIIEAKIKLNTEDKGVFSSLVRKGNNKELVSYVIGKGGKEFFNNIDDSINSIDFTEINKKHQKSNKLLKEALNGNKEAQKEFANKLELDIKVNQVETLVLVQKSNNIDKKYKNDFNNSVKSDKIIAQALEYSKKHPENSISLRISLKEYKKVLKTKDSLTIKEKKILSRLDYYDLEDPKMPIKILNNNKSEIEKQMNGKSGEVIISGKKYLATKNENGLLALLDKNNNQLITMENDGFTETIKLTNEELKTIGDSPEGISGFADFRRLMTDIGMDNDLIWNSREIIFSQIKNNGYPDFKIDKNNYLSDTNQIILLNTLLQVTGKKVLQSSNINDVKMNFKKENFYTGGITDKENVNIYGDSEISAIFINKFIPRGNITGFNISEFKKSMSNGKKVITNNKEK